MNAGKDVHLVAMADIFTDRVQDSRQRLTGDETRTGGSQRRSLFCRF